MVKIKQQLVASRAKTSRGTNRRKYIPIHETANPSNGANAQAPSNLQTRGFAASWHYTVDDNQAIQSFPHSVRCWHSGDGTGAGNFESIGIEICVNSDGDFIKAFVNAAELVKKIMKDENIPLSNVVQHNKWSGKNCPTNLRNGSKGISWSNFLRMLSEDVVGQASNPVSKPIISKPAATVKPKPTDKPKQAEHLTVDGYEGVKTISAEQRYWGTYVDGKVSRPSPMIRRRQAWLGVTVDGYEGPITISAEQRRYGLIADGKISSPSPLIKERQRRLNKCPL